MGHCVMHQTYPESWTERKITDDVIECVNSHGDRYGTQSVRFPTTRVFENREAAEAYIEGADRGQFYGGIAVKFLDFSRVEDNKKATELRQKIADTNKKQAEYIEAHSVGKQKVAYIGCRSCGSKLNREKLSGERCPVCHTDLRPASILERIASFQKRINEYDAKLKQEREKDKKKARVQWLVKFEYHC